MSSSVLPELHFLLHVIWSTFCTGHFSFSSYLLSLHPRSLSGVDAFIANILKTIQLTQLSFKRCFYSLRYPLSNTDDVNGVQISPVLWNGHHHSLPSSTPRMFKSYTLWPWENHFTSLFPFSLLPKHFLVSWQLVLATVWSIPRKIMVLSQLVASDTTAKNYYKWQKYCEGEYISDRPWIIAWMSIVKI